MSLLLSKNWGVFSSCFIRGLFLNHRHYRWMKGFESQQIIVKYGALYHHFCQSRGHVLMQLQHLFESKKHCILTLYLSLIYWTCFCKVATVIQDVSSVDIMLWCTIPWPKTPTCSDSEAMMEYYSTSTPSAIINPRC